MVITPLSVQGGSEEEKTVPNLNNLCYPFKINIL